MHGNSDCERRTPGGGTHLPEVPRRMGPSPAETEASISTPRERPADPRAASLARYELMSRAWYARLAASPPSAKEETEFLIRCRSTM